jgi:plastocyanin
MKLSSAAVGRWLFVVAICLQVVCPGAAPGSAALETAEVHMENLRFVPETLQVFTGTTVVWRNVTGPTHKVREESLRFVSPNIPQGGTFSFTFNNSGTYRYWDDIEVCEPTCVKPHTFMRGAILVVDPPKPAPLPQAPAPGATLAGLGTSLMWTNPLGARQVHLQVAPANNDGPGVDVILGPQTSFELPAPPAWFGLLPGMTYTWRVRSTEQELPVPSDHPTWGAWGTATFRTPVVDSTGISFVSPLLGSVAGSLTPTLTWATARTDLFYFELQLSKDSSFNTDGVTAFAAVYGALVHGGVTNPLNSYTAPANAPLEPRTMYFWRVRPRVQGDGVPVTYSAVFSFRTP